MRKFLSVIGLGFLTLVLAIVGIICVIGLKDMNETIAASLTSINAYNALLIAGTIGGFGGAIASGVMTIANFFSAKTYDK